MIERYLRELEVRLPSTRRGRFLRETREHLRDAAAGYEALGLERSAAEERAVGEFGRVDDVARAFAAEAAVHSTRHAGGLAAAAIALLILPLYGIPENLLPPAPWDEKPAHLAVQQVLGVALFLLALAAACAGAVIAHTRWTRVAAPLLVAAAASALLTLLLAAALTVQWRLAAPETPLVSLLALLLPFAAGPTGVAVAAAAWAAERRPLLA